ncbi:hypothetical protein [Naasia lichenicola]|uniref:Uncharacterized protein n=1 Tax=Naasia lichenicola TaxID=2565933 RepID=A0A4S4FR71_9MICO|nr:hypothetical protein [Naasia lichenicola]THG32864.1 hypothetical protein E6C64_00335 [Naasia lichenicola]
MTLTLEEDAALQALADKYEMTVSRFLWEMSMVPTSTLTEDQRRARMELSMILIPLQHLAAFTNACARFANAEKRLPPEVDQIYPAYMRLSREIHRILDRI